ncbi:MAG: DUF3857 domain-containing protein [bacterium]|nr:DUF3857 domain-containing protein [bacterium]
MSRVATWLLLLIFVCGFSAFAGEGDEVARFDYVRWKCDVMGSSATVTVQLQLTILNPAGKDFGAVSLTESKYSRVRSAEYRLLGPNGKPIQKLKLGDLTKACGFGAGFELYTDICHYFGSFAFPSYPAVIEATYTKEFDNLSFIGAPILQHNDASITLLEMTLNCDVQHPLAWKLYGLDVEPTVTTNGNRMNAAWRFENLPPDPEINRLPLEEKGKPYIAFADETFELEGYKVEGRTWKNLGVWYNKLAAKQYLPEGTSVAATAGTMEDARRIYRELIKSTRYVAVEVGLSGWQPLPAQGVASKGYGDCKGLSTLLVSRLRAAGITAYPVLVRTTSLGLIDPEFVTDGFNHLITCAVVGSDTLWLDPTCSECLPGDLPSMDENTLALLVNDSGGVLVRLPQSTSAENVLTRAVQMVIDDSTFVHLKVKATAIGNMSHSLRNFLKHAQRDQLADFTHDYLMSGDRRFKVLSQKHAGVDTLDIPVSIMGELEGTRKLDRIKQTAYVNPFVVVSRDKLDDIRLSGRTLPLSLAYPYSVYDSVNIGGSILAQCDSVVLPPQDSCQFTGGKMVVSYAMTDQGPVAIARQEYTQAVVQPEHFPELQTFITSYRKLLDRPIKLHLKSATNR